MLGIQPRGDRMPRVSSTGSLPGLLGQRHTGTSSIECLEQRLGPGRGIRKPVASLTMATRFILLAQPDQRVSTIAEEDRDLVFAGRIQMTNSCPTRRRVASGAFVEADDVPVGRVAG